MHNVVCSAFKYSTTLFYVTGVLQRTTLFYVTGVIRRTTLFYVTGVLRRTTIIQLTGMKSRIQHAYNIPKAKNNVDPKAPMCTNLYH